LADVLDVLFQYARRRLLAGVCPRAPCIHGLLTRLVTTVVRKAD
jgi:hypothetical protein